MGGEIAGNNGKIERVIDEQTGTGAGPGTRDKGPSAADAGTRTGAGTGPGAGTTAGAKTEKELSGLAILTEEEKAQYMAGDDTEKKRIMRNAKKRQRYRQQKENGGQTVKPRKVKQKKEETPALDVTQLNLIIAGISAAVASRPNCEQWLLTGAEINSITQPLTRMLAESAMFANMGQYSNQIALVMACITVFAPRLMITAQKAKEGKKRARTGQQTDTTVKDRQLRTAGSDSGKTKAGDSKPDRRNDKRPAADGGANADTVPFYGMPIC